MYLCCATAIDFSRIPLVANRVLSTQNLTADEMDQLFSSCGWVGLVGLEIFAICCSCSSIKNEAKLIGSNLHRYAMECDSVRGKIKVRQRDHVNNFELPFSQLLHPIRLLVMLICISDEVIFHSTIAQANRFHSIRSIQNGFDLYVCSK